jgi:hypothetical protein
MSICYRIGACGVVVVWRLYEQNSEGGLKSISRHSDFRRYCLLSVSVLFFIKSALSWQ